MTPFLSILVPVYNEEESLPVLAEEIRNALSSVGRPYEVILVDDGSTDRSFGVIADLARNYPEFRGVRLSRNFGQTAALAAGIDASHGEVVAFLDADLQNDPADIPGMLAKLEEGCDLVSGWRRNRKDPFLTRRLPSRIANWIISRATGVHLHDYGCTLKLWRREYLSPIRLYGEMHRFLPAYAGFLGARIAEVEVSHRPRARGISKYGLSRTFKVLLDLVTVKFMESYLTKPIYFFGGWGLAMGISGGVLSAIVLYKKLCLGIFVKDQPLFILSVVFGLAGLQVVLLGILAEILIRIYHDIKDKPAYFVRETVGVTGST